METYKSWIGVFLSVVMLSQAACSRGESFQAELADGSQSAGEIKAPSEPVGELKICSKLDFTNITWSQTLPAVEREPLALALNITGSFEGRSGFSNLVGNFDGQGISLGLLQQNLGQGSLQPLMLEGQARDPVDFQSFFSRTHAQQLNEMLRRWRSQATAQALPLNEMGYSDLDEPSAVAADLGVPLEDVQSVGAALLARNQESVNWAKTYVLNGTNVRSDWSKELRELAASAQYRSLQIEAAESMHRRALQLFDYFKMREIRSYLFFFDLIVQNGGISSSMRATLRQEIEQMVNPSETAKLEHILARRLTLVKKQWQADVKSRKSALIQGRGVVHGRSRELEREYCADLSIYMP